MPYHYSIFVKKESIVLIGMAGSGKSTAGIVLAKSLGFGFIDLDLYIKEKDHLTINDIIETAGDEALIQIEERRMHEIDLKSRVVAPGGSLIYNPRLMEYLKQQALIIFINEAFKNIEKRLKNASSRGIVGLKHKSLYEVYCERLPLYRQYADIIIDSTGKSPEQVSEDIITQRQSHLSAE